MNCRSLYNLYILGGFLYGHEETSSEKKGSSEEGSSS